MKKRLFLFLIVILILSGITYTLRWNLYYLFLNPYFIILLLFSLFILSIISGLKLKGSIITSIIIFLGLFSFNMYLLKLDIEKGVPSSASIIQRIKGEKELNSYLTLTGGKIKIKETNGDNLFIFDCYSQIKPFHRFTVKGETGNFTVKEASFPFDNSSQNEWEFYVNKDIPASITLKGDVLSGELNLTEIHLKKLNIKGSVLYINIEIGKGNTSKINIDSTSFMGKIIVSENSYVEINFSGPFLMFEGENFKKIGRNRYVKEGDNGRIYINIKGKGTLLSIEEESND